MAVQAAYAAEIVATIAAGPGLRLLHETLLSEYRRVEQAQDRTGWRSMACWRPSWCSAPASLPDAPALPDCPAVSCLPARLARDPVCAPVPPRAQCAALLFLQRRGRPGLVSELSGAVSHRPQPGTSRITAPLSASASSAAERRIIIYANKPTDDGERATDLERLMQQHGSRPRSLCIVGIVPMSPRPSPGCPAPRRWCISATAAGIRCSTASSHGARGAGHYDQRRGHDHGQ